MNWLYVIVMGYIVISALRGFHKGILREVYSVAAILIAIVFVALAMPHIRQAILKYTTVKEQIALGSEAYVRSQVNKKLEESTWTGDLELSWITLPKAVQEEFKHGTQAAIKDALESQGIYQNMAEAVADFCVTLIAFFVALIIILLILFCIGRKLDLFSKTPGIHIINMILGFFAGVVKAFLVIWLVFMLIEKTEILPTSKAMIEMIEENAVLQSLYEQNRLTELLNLQGHWY